MFKKLHLQLTAFCALVTGAILLAMTCVCLFILHADATRQSFLSYEKNVASADTNLGDQSIVSHQWLLKLEENHHLQISISDGDSPLFFDFLNHSEATQKLFEKARKKAVREGRISSLLDRKSVV